MKTQDEIDAIAERLRAGGMPDALNRWIGMTPAALAEQQAAIERHINRSSTMTSKTAGPKEAAARAMRESKATGKTPTAPKTAKKAATKKATAKAPARSSARTPLKDAGAAARGTKNSMVGDMLRRKEGCTAAEVREATGWPSVSMPAQAKAAGLTLSKFKGDDGIIRYYGAAAPE